MKATGRADLAPNEKVMDLYTSNLQLEKELHGVRRQVDDAKAVAEKVCCRCCSLSVFSLSHCNLGILRTEFDCVHRVLNHEDALQLMSQNNISYLTGSSQKKYMHGLSDTMRRSSDQSNCVLLLFSCACLDRVCCLVSSSGLLAHNHQASTLSTASCIIAHRATHMYVQLSYLPTVTSHCMAATQQAAAVNDVQYIAIPAPSANACHHKLSDVTRHR